MTQEKKIINQNEYEIRKIGNYDTRKKNNQPE